MTAVDIVVSSTAIGSVTVQEVVGNVAWLFDDSNNDVFNLLGF